MKREMVKKIVKELESGSRSIGYIARTLGIGWKTCEEYLGGLKMLGIVTETKTKRERLFTLISPRGPTLVTIPSVRAPESIDILKEQPPNPREVEDLT